MIRHLHIARTLDKQLKSLRRAGKKAEWAAVQCEHLLNLIRHEDLKNEALYCKRTKKGEYRISNCVKYDLGHGYRMVTVRNGQHLFILFIGGHDETDQWLDRHRYDVFQADDTTYFEEQISHDFEEYCHEVADETRGEVELVDHYEEQLLEKVDEELLKSVFQGLFQKQPVA